jgi:hypothetical protein
MIVPGFIAAFASGRGAALRVQLNKCHTISRLPQYRGIAYIWL